jgi:hypothetical protein
MTTTGPPPPLGARRLISNQMYSTLDLSVFEASLVQLAAAVHLRPSAPPLSHFVSLTLALIMVGQRTAAGQLDKLKESFINDHTVLFSSKVNKWDDLTRVVDANYRHSSKASCGRTIFPS